MNIQMMVQPNHESISPQDVSSITTDTRVVNASANATINDLSSHSILQMGSITWSNL